MEQNCVTFNLSVSCGRGLCSLQRTVLCGGGLCSVKLENTVLYDSGLQPGVLVSRGYAKLSRGVNEKKNYGVQKIGNFFFYKK
jgi:hypothetical protein